MSGLWIQATFLSSACPITLIKARGKEHSEKRRFAVWFMNTFRNLARTMAREPRARTLRGYINSGSVARTSKAARRGAQLRIERAIRIDYARIYVWIYNKFHNIHLIINEWTRRGGPARKEKVGPVFATPHRPAARPSVVRPIWKTTVQGKCPPSLNEPSLFQVLWVPTWKKQYLVLSPKYVDQMEPANMAGVLRPSVCGTGS